MLKKVEKVQAMIGVREGRGGGYIIKLIRSLTIKRPRGNSLLGGKDNPAVFLSVHQAGSTIKGY